MGGTTRRQPIVWVFVLITLLSTQSFSEEVKEASVQLSDFAQDIVNEECDDDQKITNIIEVHREDLDKKVVSHYEVVCGTKYVLVRASAEIGDYDEVAEGDLPAPSSELNAEAKTRSSECHKYYMMTPGGEMLCKNKDGQVVATTVPEELLLPDVPVSEITIEKLTKYFKSKEAEEAVLFQHHAKISAPRGRREERATRSADEQTGHVRQRRKQYKPWGSWYYWVIPYESTKFPDYKQFNYGGCPVGCGPVAWAMVFGYYDRRSHATSSYGTGSRCLYRSGLDGTTGSSGTVAPAEVYNSDNRIRRYIVRLSKILGTFCLFGGGATLSSKMDKVSGFYKARQITGNPKIYEKKTWLTWAGVYTKSVRDWVKGKLKAKIPVIIGWKVGVFAWHYPVATKLRIRSRKYRYCSWSWLCPWKTEYQYQVYLHMGWGGSGNKYVNLQAYYAVAAVY